MRKRRIKMKEQKEEKIGGVSRRVFITGAGSAVVGAAVAVGIPSPVASKDKEYWLPEKWDYEADVVVVGYGGAGVVAAITANDTGAKVLILEKAPFRGGGNTSISAGMFCSPTNRSDAVKYLNAASAGRTPLDVIEAWAEEVCKNKDWWDQMGIKYVAPRWGRTTEYMQLPGADAMTTCTTVGSGQALFEALDRHRKERGIEVLFDSRGKDLIQDGITKEILGIYAEKQGKKIAVKAKKGVVLCTGGMEFNEEMKNEFLQCYPMKFYGWRFNTGDGIKMAQKVGADLWHMDTVCGGNNSWFNDPEYDFGIACDVKSNNYIWVDSIGRRYCDETIQFNPHGGWRLHAQYDFETVGFSRIPSYIIFDETAQSAGSLGGMVGGISIEHGGMKVGRLILPQELGGYEGWSLDNKPEIEKGWVKKGDTIEELAAEINGAMDPALLKKSIETYNSYCASGNDPDFGREPKKLASIETPPYYSIPLYPGLVSTGGGPRRNANGQVVDINGNPIRRLYSAGSCGSVYGHTYSVTGGNLAELAAFGRISGRNAAALTSWEQT
jgi:succinate dehydrogenase/fumarate reductase flavoprotein subunit